MPESDAGKRPSRRALAPVPLLLVLILLLSLWETPKSFESPYLLLLLNFVFAVLASLLAAYLAFRAFAINGRPGVMILGCGLLIWGTASMAATVLVHHGPNVLVTIHNLGIGLASLCHLSAAIIRTRSEKCLENPGFWLTLPSPEPSRQREW